MPSKLTHFRLMPAACALLVMTGCGLSKRAVPPGFTPLDATNQAKLPAATSTDMYPETINIVNGHDNADNWDWADGMGYVHAPILQVWAALQDSTVVADRRQLDSWQIQSFNAVPMADESFVLGCVTHELSLGYTVIWKGEATMGTTTDPAEVIVRGDLDGSASVLGQAVMSLLSDSIVLTPIDANTTEYAAIRHRSDSASSPTHCQEFVSDVYNSVVAKIHGTTMDCAPKSQNSCDTSKAGCQASCTQNYQ